MAQATATQIYEHNGKKYRLADKRDVGNNFVRFSDTNFDDAMNSRIGTISTLTEINDEEFPFCAKSTQWKLAFVETSEVPPAVVPESEPVDTRPEPPAGWRYVAEDEVLVDGDAYMKDTGVVDGDVCSGIGSTVSQLKKQGMGCWASYWVGVIRKKPSPEAPEFNFEASWLNTMCETIHAKQKATGWWDAADNPLVVPTKIALIVSECAEALEGHRRDAMDDKLTHRKALDTELADVFIRLCDLAGFLKVPLGTIVAEKEAYNASRADHKPEVRKAANGKRY
jgi:NTP pyrophosphatase (non-canonical NTP hydrolase)